MTLTPKPATQRLGWIDSAKGIGIVLVVVGHAWRGLQASGLITNASLFRTIDTAIYAFHMPFFFFLSGLLIERALLASQPGAFVLSRVRRLLWPLALWTWVFFLFKGLAGSLTNKPAEWTDFPILPLPPQEHFWFLWALFVIQMVLLLFRPLLKVPDHRQRDWALLLLASVVLCLSGLSLGGLAIWLGPAVAHAPFFLLGAAASGMRHQRPPVWAGLLAFAACLATIAAIFYLPDAKWVRLAVGGGATLLLCATIMALEQPLFSRPKLRWIAVLGTASLAIYVSHTIFSAAARIVLLKAGVSDLWTHIAIGTLIGLAAPAALYAVARRAGLSGKLGF